MRYLLAILLALTTLSVPVTASARGPGASRPATFFIVEGQLGYGFGGVFSEAPEGLASRLTIGAGGKLVGFPTRFYGVLNLGLSELTGTISDQVDRARTERTWRSWSVGLRALTPIVGRLRLLAEVAAGQVSVGSVATLYGGTERYEFDDQSLLIEVGLGLQYRVNLHLSLGVKMGLALTPDLAGWDLLIAVTRTDVVGVGVVSPSYLMSATLHL